VTNFLICGITNIPVGIDTTVETSHDLRNDCRNTSVNPTFMIVIAKVITVAIDSDIRIAFSSGACCLLIFISSSTQLVALSTTIKQKNAHINC
jgi:hypothetical protein